MNNRIALLCLSGKRPSLSLATSSDNSLHIMKIEHPPADIVQLKNLLDEKQPRYKEKGVTLYVDDPSGLLADYGYRCSLNEVNSNGQHALKQSLDRYFTLQAAGAITFPQATHGFEIPRTMVNTRVKDTGETYYNIDWESLEDNARATLLLIHCSFSMGLHQVAYAQAMFEHLNQGDDDNGHVEGFIAGLINHFSSNDSANSERQKLIDAGRNLL